MAPHLVGETLLSSCSQQLLSLSQTLDLPYALPPEIKRVKDTIRLAALGKESQASTKNN